MNELPGDLGTHLSSELNNHTQNDQGPFFFNDLAYFSCAFAKSLHWKIILDWHGKSLTVTANGREKYKN